MDFPFPNVTTTASFAIGETSTIMSKTGHDDVTNASWNYYADVTTVVDDDVSNATSQYYVVTAAAAVDTLMSKETTVLIETIVQAVIMPTIVLFGVTFNVINMAVFLRQGLGDRVTLCLFSLSVCDTCYMLSLLSFRAYSLAALINKAVGEFWRARMIFMVGVYHVFADTSDCITMLISVERCVCVLLPLKVKTWMSIRNILVYIAVVVLVCGPANLVFCFKYDVVSYPDPATNVTRYATIVTSFTKRYPFVAQLTEIVNIIVPVTAFTVVIVATILIAVRMRHVLSWRKNTATVGRGGATTTSQKERREAAVTRMLTTICVIFTICLVPYVLSAFFRLAVPEYNPEGKYSNTLYATTGIMHVFLCINASINFIVYVNMSSKFKATLLGMLGRRKMTSSSDVTSQASTVKNNSSSEVVTEVGSIAMTTTSVVGESEKVQIANSEVK